MTEAIKFDTHRFVKNLTAVGFTERQAEVLADEQVQLLNSNLATKTDVRAVKADTLAVKTDLHAVKAELQVEIQKVKAELLKWMVGALTAQTAVIVTLILGLPRIT